MQALQRVTYLRGNCLQQGLRLAPSSAEAHNSLAGCCRRKKKSARDPRVSGCDQLKPDFRKRTSTWPTLFCEVETAGAHFVRQKRLFACPRRLRGSTHSGTSVDASGELPSAIEEMRQAIVVEPNRAELHDDLARSGAAGLAPPLTTNFQGARTPPGLERRIALACCVTRKIFAQAVTDNRCVSSSAGGAQAHYILAKRFEKPVTRSGDP